MQSDTRSVCFATWENANTNAKGKGRESCDLEFANWRAYTRIACCANKGLDSCQITAASLRWRQVWLADWLMWALHEMCVCVCVCDHVETPISLLSKLVMGERIKGGFS